MSLVSVSPKSGLKGIFLHNFPFSGNLPSAFCLDNSPDMCNYTYIIKEV